MTKTLILHVPPLDHLRPPLSGAILASLCASLGHNVAAKDVNINLRDHLRSINKPDSFFDDVFYEMVPDYSEDQKEVINQWLLNYLDQIQVNSFDYIIVSLFSYLAQSFTNILLPNIRQKSKAKIIIGGAGIKRVIGNSKTYGTILKDNNLIDEYIVGEAEESLIQYFKHSSGHGIGNLDFVQITNLDQYPFPDYSYYDLSAYRNDENKLEFNIIGSRGCVRDCTFCDVRVTTPKYQFRSGQNIASEIIQHYETYGVTDFYFADSLINGSFKAFNDMCNALANYRFHTPISWSGQYIIRSKETTPKDHFDLIKQGGGKRLYAGIESGCDRIRFEIGKKFTNDDIEFYLENFQKHGIEILFLFFTGYISETIEDYNETLQMFSRWQKYVASGTIIGVETLNLLSVLPDTHLESIAINKNFVFQQDAATGHVNTKFWLDPARPEFDFKERVRRHLGIMEEGIKYSWPLWNAGFSLSAIEQSFVNFKNPQNRYMLLKQT